MWFGYVPQIKNTNVISARGLHFSRSLLPAPRFHPPPVLSPFYILSFFTPRCFLVSNQQSFCRSLHYPTDVSAFPAFAESSVSTLESHLHMYTHALTYKLLFSETWRRGVRGKKGRRERSGVWIEHRRRKERVSERKGSRCRDETIRAGKSVCSVKLSLRGSSPANLWDTYNASQEYCSVCRPSIPLPHISLFLSLSLSSTCLFHAPLTPPPQVYVRCTWKSYHLTEYWKWI